MDDFEASAMHQGGQVAIPTTPIYPIKSYFWAGVGQTLTADINIALHANQPHADSPWRSKTI